jgi:hypothetical protein
VPVTKGWVSEAPDDRHSNVSFWPVPADAAPVELLVAGAVDVLFEVAVPILPVPVAELVDEVDAPAELLAERPPPPPVDGLNDAVGGLDDDAAPPAVAPLVELVAMLSIVAPRPAEPAEAPPVELPALAGAATVTVGALVSVAPEVTFAVSVPVLDKVLPDVTSDDCAAPDELVEDGGAAGKPCTPLPTWPCPPLPGVEPPTGSLALGLTVCAAAGCPASSTMANTAKIAFTPLQRRAGAPVPDRWLRRCASATVAPRRTRT